jgi:hypothetical protein
MMMSVVGQALMDGIIWTAVSLLYSWILSYYPHLELILFANLAQKGRANFVWAW